MARRVSIGKLHSRVNRFGAAKIQHRKQRLRTASMKRGVRGRYLRGGRGIAAAERRGRKR